MSFSIISAISPTMDSQLPFSTLAMSAPQLTVPYFAVNAVRSLSLSTLTRFSSNKSPKTIIAAIRTEQSPPIPNPLFTPLKEFMVSRDMLSLYLL